MPELARRRKRPRLRHRVQRCLRADHGAHQPFQRRAGALDEPGLRLHRSGRPLLHRIEHHAAEKKPGRARTRPRQDRTRHWPFDEPADADEGPAPGLQQGQPGRQGTAVRHRRHGDRHPAHFHRHGGRHPRQGRGDGAHRAAGLLHRHRPGRLSGEKGAALPRRARDGGKSRALCGGARHRPGGHQPERSAQFLAPHRRRRARSAQAAGLTRRARSSGRHRTEPGACAGGALASRTRRRVKRSDQTKRSGARQGHAVLPLILAAAILVADFAHLIAFEEQHLRAALARVNLRGQRRGVGELQRHITFPLGFERRDVDNDAAAGISALAQTDGEHIARDAEILHRARQREAVGRDDAHIAPKIDKGLFIEVFRIDDGAVDVGEDLEFVGATDVVTVARRAIADDAVSTDLAHLRGLERLDHRRVLRHAADPLIGFDTHDVGAVWLKTAAIRQIDATIPHAPGRRSEAGRDNDLRKACGMRK